MKPTYEELESRNQELERANQQLESRCQRLEELLKKALERIAVLEERLNQNSNNSSKPPSTDRKSNKNASGKIKPPRKGFARSLVPLEEVDVHQICQLDECSHCGSHALSMKDTPVILQQVELPEELSHSLIAIITIVITV